ncbi:hypothetical protein D3C85_1870760 [compost metagenome]
MAGAINIATMDTPVKAKYSFKCAGLRTSALIPAAVKRPSGSIEDSSGCDLRKIQGLYLVGRGLSRTPRSRSPAILIRCL